MRYLNVSEIAYIIFMIEFCPIQLRQISKEYEKLFQITAFIDYFG